MHISNQRYLELLKGMKNGSIPSKSMLKRIIICDAMDEEIWRTTEEGKHFKFDNETGEIKAGFGGKHNGKKIGTKWAGSSSGSSSGSDPESDKRQREWAAKLSEEKKKITSEDQSDQALFAYKSGVAGYDEAVEAMNNGTATQLVDRYYDIMEKNGDPTPTKPVSGQLDKVLNESIKNGKYSDPEAARLGMIQEMTGQSPEESQKTLEQMTTWFGGSWSHADTKVVDKYIEQDSACEGKIYRGMHFTEEEYQAFMSDKAPGSSLNMRGMNSSWTTNPEVAYTFYRNGERKVKVVCLKNRTAAPVSHLSTHGEDEVLAHSKAQWTIVGINEGDRFTEIRVIESGSFMSDEKHKELRKQSGLTTDAAIDDNYKPIFERMQEQQKYMAVDPDSVAFAEELSRKYSVAHGEAGTNDSDATVVGHGDGEHMSVKDSSGLYWSKLKRFFKAGLSPKSMLARVFITDALLPQEDTEDGGPGSGNWGHRGRPGQVGGSGKGGGAQYRGGRGDIAYHSSKADWLNGLQGEKQHEAQSWMKRMRAQYSQPGEAEKSVEQNIMEDTHSGSERTKAKMLNYMAEARKWDTHAGRMINANWDDKDRKLAETLGNKYGLKFVGGVPLPDDNEAEISAWDKEDLRTWQDLKSKAMGGPTSGQEPPDELLYEAGLKERPKPQGPDLSWYDRPRSWRSQNMEHYMSAALNEGYPRISSKEEFQALNQRFLDRLKYEKPGSAAETTYALRAMQGMRNAIDPDSGLMMPKGALDKLSDDEKARFLEVVNQYYPSYDRIESADKITDRVLGDVERTMILRPLRSNADKKAINDYVILQEKMLGGFEPTPKEQYEAAKLGRENAAAAAAQAKADREKAERERKSAEWKADHPPEVIRKMYAPETISGVKRNADGFMQHENANQGRVNNPSDRNHRINCQTCVYAYEMRRRGYDVFAKGRNTDNDSERAQHSLSKEQKYGWIDPETGESPVAVQPEKRLSDKTGKSWLESVVGHTNERYTFSYCYKGTHGAHVVSLFRNDKGEITIYDPQIGNARKNIWSGDEVQGYLESRGISWNSTSGGNWKPKILRVDNALPRKEYYDTILNAGSAV